MAARVTTSGALVGVCLLAIAATATYRAPEPATAQAAAADCTGSEVFVARNGRDTWSGRFPNPLPDRTDGPVATLSRARDILRASPTLDTAIVRGGTYSLGTPLELGPADSGTTWQAAGGERAVIRGGELVTGWTQGAGGVWSAPVGLAKVEQLTLKGKRQHEARRPNFNPSDPIRGGWLFADQGNSRGSLTYRPGSLDPAQLAPGTKISVFPRFGYTSEIVTITGVNPSTRRITFTPQVDYPVDRSSRYFVFGAKAFLDQPGEWWFDAAAHRIYFRAPSGFNGADAVASGSGSLFRLDRANDVTIAGFAFSDTAMTDNDAGLGAVDVDDGLRNEISRNSFTNVGKGVRIDNASHSNVVSQNDFSHTWGSAVELLPATHQNSVVDNRMQWVSEVFRASGAVRLIETWGNSVAHNRIQFAPRFGIDESNYDPSQKSGGNLIEYNQIFQTGRETPDVGAIYVFSHSDPTAHLGDTIRFNHVFDSGGLETRPEGGFEPGRHFSWGIYLDDYTSRAQVRGNFVDLTAFGGLMVHGGSQNKLINNLVVRPEAGGSVQLLEIERAMVGNEVARNIISAPLTDGEIVSLDSPTAKPSNFHHNLYDNPTNKALVFGDRTWPGWRAAGGDPGSPIADPRFVGGGDHHLQPSSPAFGLGYQELPWEQIGLTASVGPPVAGCGP